MPAGLLKLASISAKSLYFHDDPTITFFKIPHKRHTDFTTETLTQNFNTDVNFGRKVSCSIGKNGDLLSRTYIYVELPRIFSKEPVAWVKYLGFALIKKATIEIGSEEIDSQTGEWLFLHHNMSKKFHQRGLDEIIGNKPDLYQYSTEKNAVQLYIPLAFWFCNHINQSIPLCALDHADVTITVEFSPLDKCLKQHSKQIITIQEQYCQFHQYEIIEQTHLGQTAKVLFLSFENGQLCVAPIKGTVLAYNVNTDESSEPFTLRGTKSQETCIPIQSTTSTTSTTIPVSVNIKFACLFAEYIHLDNIERNKFRERHQQLITCTQTIQDVKITTNYQNIVLNSLHHMTTQIVWRCIGIDEINNRDYFRYDVNRHVSSAQLTVNGVVRMSKAPGSQYHLLPFHQHHHGGNISGVYFYVFALDPMEFQPTGHINFSQMSEIHLELTTGTHVTPSNPVYLKAYTQSYNYLSFENGVCRVVFVN
jgi:hypothetical protein